MLPYAKSRLRTTDLKCVECERLMASSVITSPSPVSVLWSTSHAWHKTWDLLTCQGKNFWENCDFLQWFFSLWYQYLCPCVKPVGMAGSTHIKEWNSGCWIRSCLSWRSFPHLMMLLLCVFDQLWGTLCWISHDSWKKMNQLESASISIFRSSI